MDRPGADRADRQRQLVAKQDLLDAWLTASTSPIGSHFLVLLREREGARGEVLGALRSTARGHYVAPQNLEKLLSDHGAVRTAAMMREIMPGQRRARSGDVGEILV